MSVAALPDGGWVNVWAVLYSVYQRAYDAQGQLVGTETYANTDTTSQKDDAKVTALADGGWVVTWVTVSDNLDGSGKGVYQRVYGADGLPVGGEMRVNAYTEGNQSEFKVIALPDGSWESDSRDGDGSGVYQRAFWINNAPIVDNAIDAPQATEEVAFSFTARSIRSRTPMHSTTSSSIRPRSRTATRCRNG